MRYIQKLYKLWLNGENMLTKQEKNAWLAGLRSGEYDQTTQVLINDKNQYCALGVLADVVSKCRDIVFNDACDLLVDELLSTHQFVAVSTKNDAGDSFSQIADYVEENITAAAERELAAA